MPSIAADTIPPAYPAPSPTGYKPRTSTWQRLSLSRGTRTGDDVRVSSPIRAASGVRKPRALRPNSSKPFCRRPATNGGNNRSMRPGCTPGAYDDGGKVELGLEATKSVMRCAGAHCVLPAASKNRCSMSRWKYIIFSSPYLSYSGRSSGRISTTMPELAHRVPRLEGDIPFTTSCPGSLAAGIITPPGHIQNEYTALPSTRVSIEYSAAGSHLPLPLGE